MLAGPLGHQVHGPRDWLPQLPCLQHWPWLFLGLVAVSGRDSAIVCASLSCILQLATILEGLAASGLRSLRYALEVRA